MPTTVKGLIEWEVLQVFVPPATTKAVSVTVYVGIMMVIVLAMAATVSTTYVKRGITGAVLVVQHVVISTVNLAISTVALVLIFHLLELAFAWRGLMWAVLAQWCARLQTPTATTPAARVTTAHVLWEYLMGAIVT